MVLIETTASEINKAEKWKWWLWFPWAWCGICEAAANCLFMSLFQVPAHYRHTESLIKTHALMEDSSEAPSSTGDMLNLTTPNSSSLNGMFHRLYPPQLPLPTWWIVEKLDLTNNQCFFLLNSQADLNASFTIKSETCVTPDSHVMAFSRCSYHRKVGFIG